jgi:dinuclear metal center YbgI/SA1388 family protein
VKVAISPGSFPEEGVRERANCSVGPVPVRLEAVIADLDALLDPAAFDDFGPNGLQVPGAETVARVATAVSANADVFVRAAAADAQLVLVHHGLWWKGMPQHIDAALHRRLKPLFAHDLALAAYHLPLDAHPEVGNNALLARALGGTDLRRFADLGFSARLDVPAAELRDRVAAVTGREPLHLASGPDRVRSIAVVSGAAASYLPRAIAEGHDAFLTGEPAERVYAQAREGGVHVFAAGHHATETFGVRALGDRLAAAFGIEHVFLDEPNPV